jgi:uncharacterized protein (TIGR01777 family)
MKIALNGASGFIGTALQETFKNCVILDRNDNDEMLVHKLKDVDVVINLAGAPIIKRWSDPYKETLVRSRIDTTRQLVNAVNRSEVKHFISTSAIGIYPNDISCDESCEQRDDDFLTLLAEAWENEALKCDKKTTILRFGIVLGKEGGALAQMLPPFRFGLGGTIADGSMITSWIHIKDLLRIYSFVIEKGLAGTYNATAPHPVSNHTFTKTLGRLLHRPTLLPIPHFALRLMYAEAASVLIDSKEVYPKALQKAGFIFAYEEINTALQEILI